MQQSRDARQRHQSPYTFGEKLKRMLWAVVEATAYRWTWPTWYRYRAWLLRCFGANVDPRSRLRRTCRFVCPWNLTVGADTATGEDVWFYCLGPIVIGERVTLSHFAKLCAGSHDPSDPVRMPLLRPPINIEDDVWIATAAFVGPDVTVKEGAILGGAAVTFRDLESWTIYAGNPAAPLKARPRLEGKNDLRTELPQE
jgi:putative colanic acid biosynthesis acetyltransferase WcaF